MPVTGKVTLMADLVKKTDLPTKTCMSCSRPLKWRRKWAKTWDEVKFCFERCRRSTFELATSVIISANGLIRRNIPPSLHGCAGYESRM
ncbi:DUF2256 domain-containing protein [Rhizobium sp. Root1204]|uniref:DUF2256 domain-containing protein n=1 Tax=unclassified Rhizobium TaxID=2613769 RepID=UPI00329A5AEB